MYALSLLLRAFFQRRLGGRKKREEGEKKATDH